MKRVGSMRLVLGVGVGVGVVMGVAGCSGTYVRETTHERVQSTPERLVRGSYLVNQAMACGACHTPRAGTFPLGGERADEYLAGAVLERPKQGLKLWVPNLTPDVETGLGGWSDDEIMRAVRDGIGRDGHFLFPVMPFSSYQYVCDEDLRAIVSYLRTVPAVKSERPFGNELGFFLSFLLNRGVMHHAPARDVPPPARGDQLAAGAYVMRLGACWECHSATSRAPKDLGEEGFLSGAERADELPGVGVVYARNLTPARRTGLGRYSAAQIERALREGTRLDGKSLAPPMSLLTPHFSGLSDEDLDALVAFLKSVPAFEHEIPERVLDRAFAKTLPTP
jgi:mono/diheme cytochrome c family protein